MSPDLLQEFCRLSKNSSKVDLEDLLISFARGLMRQQRTWVKQGKCQKRARSNNPSESLWLLHFYALPRQRNEISLIVGSDNNVVSRAGTNKIVCKAFFGLTFPVSQLQNHRGVTRQWFLMAQARSCQSATKLRLEADDERSRCLISDSR